MVINKTIGPVRFSYLRVFEPSAMNEKDDKKYSLSAIIPKKDKTLIAEIEAIIEEVIQESKSVWNGKIPKDLKSCLRDGDEDRPDSPEYANCMFLNSSTKQKPGVVDENRDPILDPTQIKSGDYGYINVTFFAYNNTGKGVAAGLNCIMKTEDGEALGSSVSIDEAFGGIGKIKKSYTSSKKNVNSLL